MTSICGNDRQIEVEEGTPQTITVNGLTEDDQCSYIAKTTCGLPKFYLSHSNAEYEVGTKVTVIEWQSEYAESTSTDFWAPSPDTEIPHIVRGYNEPVGSVLDFRYQDTTFNIDSLATATREWNLEVSAYNKGARDYVNDAIAFNQRADVLAAQYASWESYNAFDLLFYAIEDVVTATLPAKPSLPTRPMSEVPPAFHQVVWP